MTTNDVQHTTPRLAEHTQRLDWMKLAPDVFKAMVRLDTATGQGVEANVLHLVKIRSSQINRCAFCIDMHTKDALAAGESVDRIIQLDGWRESKHFYTAKEIAAIELTEAITVLTGGCPGRGICQSRRRIQRNRVGLPHRRDHDDQRVEPIRGVYPDGSRALHAGLLVRRPAAPGNPSPSSPDAWKEYTKE